MPGLSQWPGLTLKASINSIICFGYQVYGEAKPKCINAWDFPNWKKNINDDSALLKALVDVLSTADAVVTHNGRSFDMKVVQTRLMINNMLPLPKVQHIDTKLVVKRHLSLFNNRLDTLGQCLVNDKKMENGGWSLWEKVMQRHIPSMDLMERYCKQDVALTMKVFKKLMPLISDIPNYNMFSNKDDKDVCPNCGSSRLQGNGQLVTKTAIRQRLRCLDCGTSSSKVSEHKRPK